MKVLVWIGVVIAVAMACVAEDSPAVLGADGVVRIQSAERAESAVVTFSLPVEAHWRVLSQEGSGMNVTNAWRFVGNGRTVPWYVLMHDGNRTYGFGVKVQPKAMCT